MNDSYSDILDRIKEPPLWWDYYGVPRFDWPPTVPEQLLGMIKCSDCGRKFKVSLAVPVYIREFVNLRHPGKSHNVVAVNTDVTADYSWGENYRLAEGWHYGDPPNHGCVGDTMSSIPEPEWPEYPELEHTDG